MDERTQYAALHEWFLSPQGRAVAYAFTTEIQSMEPTLQGQSLLQLGVCGNNTWLASLNFQAKWLIDPALSAQAQTIDASINTLPIARESIDCVIAPLTLEMCARNPVDEIDRITKSMGYIVFLGINPWSFWGLATRWGPLSDVTNASSVFSSALSLKLAMLSRGYRQCYLNNFYYIPPFKKAAWIDKLEFLNQMGKMVWPFLPGFYCLIVQKYEAPQTVIPYRPLRNSFNLARA